MFKVVIACLLSCVLPTGGPSKPDVQAALGRAEVYMEQGYNFGVEMFNTILAIADKGETDVGPETWNEVIVPLGIKCSLRLEEAAQEIDSVMPDKYYKKEFWRGVYNCYIEVVGIAGDMKDLSFYQSEYRQIIMNADSFIEMYLTIIHVKLENLKKNIENISKIRNDYK